MIREPLARVAAAFAEHAQRFCDFIESASGLSLRARLETARTLLLALYGAGAALPRVEPPESPGFPESEGEGEVPSAPQPEGWAGFDAFDIYWEVFDPYVDDGVVSGSLSDDLLDVYVDVQRGLAVWRSPAPPAAAIWEWRFHFDHHWGDHAADALRALHRACRAAERSPAPGASSDAVCEPAGPPR